jgi:hypothetical protein
MNGNLNDDFFYSDEINEDFEFFNVFGGDVDPEKACESEFNGEDIPF